ncbi:MAG: shikimate kinase [Archaeoglobaceae archaeon]|nr:shikimate kinase [Archaeoglobaceae archaeon]MDW8127729.1 shikimate kinase [Archaeoglobaceae archaeon]
MLGKAYAAGTILNALATGTGSAFGIELTTKAKVKLDDENVLIVNGEERETEILEKILSHFGIKAQVTVRTEIPERSGLGSSSAFINAILCSLMKNKELLAHEILKLNAEISLKAGISYTGAFDDASASLLGGFVISENYQMKLRSWILSRKKTAVLIPEFKRKKVDWDKIKAESYRLSNALEDIKKLKFFEVMVENTKFYCEMLGYPIEIAERLWREGICCGLSGNGPVFVAIGSKEEVLTAKEIWQEYGRVLLRKVAEKPAEDVVISSELFMS